MTSSRSQSSRFVTLRQSSAADEADEADADEGDDDDEEEEEEDEEDEEDEEGEEGSWRSSMRRDKTAYSNFCGAPVHCAGAAGAKP